MNSLCKSISNATTVNTFNLFSIVFLTLHFDFKVESQIFFINDASSSVWVWLQHVKSNSKFLVSFSLKVNIQIFDHVEIRLVICVSVNVNTVIIK